MFERIDGAKAIPACEKALASRQDDSQLRYWTLRAYLAAGLSTDQSLEKALTHYLTLRKNGEHDLALYYMSHMDEEIRDAVSRHEKNIRKRFYWCERDFCGYQIYKDLVALSKDKKVRYLRYYASRGYVPAARLLLSYQCSHNTFTTGNVSNDLIRHHREKHTNGDAISQYLFAYSYFRNTSIDTSRPTHVSQNCGPWIKLPDVEKHILPALKKYSMNMFFMDDFAPLIAAVEHDLEVNGISATYLTAIDEIQTKISNGTRLTEEDVAFVAKIVDDRIEADFFKKDKILAMGKNLHGLMLFYGVGVSKDAEAAIATWYAVALENKFYSVPSIFNLLSHSELLSAEQREFLVFKVNSTEIMSRQEMLAYTTYIIEQPGFENVLSNRLNARARSVILIDIRNAQITGTGAAPPNASPAEKLYEYLSAESIAQDRNAKLAVLAAVVAGLAIVGAAAGDAPANKPQKPDRCAGINGLGWIDNTLGNAAAFFGCSKY